MTAKPIETIYKGYRFRSRLEARWAVFFDAMRETWEYEKEGYDLEGVYYLPDFYLPRFNCFIEVKGEAPTSDEYKKAELLRDHADKAIAIFHGLPSENWGTLYAWDIGESSGGSSDWPVRLCNDSDGELVFGLDFEKLTPRTLYASPSLNVPLPFTYGFLPCIATDIALDAAKQARFEHGEKPKW